MVIIIVKYLKVMRKHYNDVYFLKMKKLRFKEVKSLEVRYLGSDGNRLNKKEARLQNLCL